MRVGGRSYRGEIVQVDTRTGHSSGAKHAKVCSTYTLYIVM